MYSLGSLGCLGGAGRICGRKYPHEDKASDEATWSPPMVVVMQSPGEQLQITVGRQRHTTRSSDYSARPPAQGGTSRDSGGYDIYEVENISSSIDPPKLVRGGAVYRQPHQVGRIRPRGRYVGRIEPGDSLQSGALDAISDYWAARIPCNEAATIQQTTFGPTMSQRSAHR
jgi:hypothetical protein